MVEFALGFITVPEVGEVGVPLGVGQVREPDAHPRHDAVARDVGLHPPVGVDRDDRRLHRPRVVRDEARPEGVEVERVLLHLHPTEGDAAREGLRVREVYRRARVHVAVEARHVGRGFRRTRKVADRPVGALAADLNPCARFEPFTQTARERRAHRRVRGGSFRRAALALHRTVRETDVRGRVPGVPFAPGGGGLQNQAAARGLKPAAAGGLNVPVPGDERQARFRSAAGERQDGVHRAPVGG